MTIKRTSGYQRLKHTRLYAEAYSQQHSWVGRFMVLWLREGEGAALRLGVVSSRRVGGAVERNRARRLLRELYRQLYPRLRGRHDVILIARQRILKGAWPELLAEMQSLLKKSGLLIDG